MYIYKREDLKKMSNKTLAELNSQLDELAEEINFKEADYLKDLSNAVDQATTEEECNKMFISYLYNKQEDINEAWEQYSKKIPLEWVIRMLKD